MVPFWNPHLKKDIDEIEKVQCTVTRLLSGSKEMSYEERLRVLNIGVFWRKNTLSEIRVKGFQFLDENEKFKN